MDNFNKKFFLLLLLFVTVSTVAAVYKFIVVKDFKIEESLIEQEY